MLKFIQSTHNVFCRKFAAVCRKISIHVQPTFLTRDAATYNVHTRSDVGLFRLVDLAYSCQYERIFVARTSDELDANRREHTAV